MATSMCVAVCVCAVVCMKCLGHGMGENVAGSEAAGSGLILPCLAPARAHFFGSAADLIYANFAGGRDPDFVLPKFSPAFGFRASLVID